MSPAELDWDDYSIFVVDKPEAGIVELGKYATAIGEKNIATERAATAIGRENVVQGKYGVALGRGNIIKAYAGVALGRGNTIEPTALYAFAEGVQNIASGVNSHVSGSNTKATGAGAFTEGYKTEAHGDYAHASGYMTKATALYSISDGCHTIATATGAHSSGYMTNATGIYAVTEGKGTEASGNYAHASGDGTKATALYSISEGVETEATAIGAHASGHKTKATGAYSTTKGNLSEASGDYSSAEGVNAKAIGKASHARGMLTSAEASYSTAVGVETRAMHEGSFAEGSKTIAEAKYSHAAGIGTHTRTAGGFVVGTYNGPAENHLFAVGNGTSDAARANALAVMKDGHTNFFGHRAQRLADAVDDTDAVNLRQLNNLNTVFWATYQQTTYQEVFDAYQAGKLVMCKYNNKIYSLNEISQDEDTNYGEALFLSTNDRGAPADGLLLVTIVKGYGEEFSYWDYPDYGYGYSDYMIDYGTRTIYIYPPSLNEVTGTDTPVLFTWNYRKWASGIAECWGESAQIVFSTLNLNEYLCFEDCGSCAFPFSFTEIPAVYCSFVGTSSSVWSWASNVSINGVGAMNIANENGGGCIGRATLHAIGRWK